MTALIRERPRPYRSRPAFREAELVRLWQAQQVPPEALVTDSGDELQIVYRGRHGAGPGPDFRDAILGTNTAIGGAELLKGDVELHVRSSDFRRHGHHLDRAYLRLALHVVFVHDGGPTVLADGRIVPTVALEQWVRRRAGELRAVLADQDEFREPCHAAVERLGSDTAIGTLSEIGEVRLRAKASALTGWIEAAGPDEALYRALGRGLGLTRNAEPMLAITLHLPLSELRALIDAGEPERVAEAALLGTAGFLSAQLDLWPQPQPQSHEDPARESYLPAIWRRLGLPAAGNLTWATGPQRPGSGPRERLRGLAALAVRPGPPLDATRSDWLALLGRGPRALLKVLQVPDLIGQDRALELAVNAVLPWLLTAYPDDEQIRAAALAVYRDLPAPAAYGQTKALVGALLDDRGRSLVRGAAMMQGALQMTRDWCTQGGCGRCPLS